ISDTGRMPKRQPSISTGWRGERSVEGEVSIPKRALHSGLAGGAVPNPLKGSRKVLASLHQEMKHSSRRRFDNKKEERSQAERNEMANRPFSQEEYNKALDINDVYGEAGYTTNERNSIRPTLDVNGIWGGYTGEGAKTVIPSKAYAKISMRLVPNQ